MRNNLKFNLSGGHSERELIRALAQQYTIKKQSDGTERHAFYDTFDWRLFNKSLVLFTSGNRLYLRKLYKNSLIENIDIKVVPVLAKDFPKGRLKDRLLPIINMRALIELVVLSSRLTLYQVLNQDEKTVARLFFEKIHLSNAGNPKEIAAYLWLKPVKGYLKYSQNLTKRLEESGLTLERNADLLSIAMQVTGQKPGSYSAKLNIPLNPEMPANEATKTILRFLLQIIKTNEVAIEHDRDTEFLHDFRIAIRRTRSALGQIKNVFPQETTERFKRDFAFIGKLSNDLRDQDVYLLNEAAYKSMLPLVLRDDIEPLFDYLKKERSKSFRKVVTSLKTDRYRRIIRDWESFLNVPYHAAATEQNAGLPIIDLASIIIYKQYRRALKSGNRILENTEDEMLHRLRITCKKLRYLIEFFSGLYPRKKIERLIRQLKKLQDNLGDFNDLCVQEEYLLFMAQNLPLTSRQSKNTLVAMGSLIEKLNTKKQIIRKNFPKTFNNFSSPQNQQFFIELFVLKLKKALS